MAARAEAAQAAKAAWAEAAQAEAAQAADAALAKAAQAKPKAARAEAAQAAKAARAEAAQAAMAARAEAAQAARAEAKAARAEAAQAAKKPRAHTWSPAEDAQLARAALRGCRGRAQMPWTLIAAEVEGRDADACRKRWVNQLCPQLNHSGVWSEAEDAALLRLVEQHGNKYAEMTRLLGTRRSENAVKSRVLKLTCVASFGALPDAACVLQTPAATTHTVACGVPVEAADGRTSDEGLDELAAQLFADGLPADFMCMM
jgi:hypothetical protein